jgi:hypothetical protein
MSTRHGLMFLLDTAVVTMTGSLRAQVKTMSNHSLATLRLMCLQTVTVDPTLATTHTRSMMGGSDLCHPSQPSTLHLNPLRLKLVANGHINVMRRKPTRLSLWKMMRSMSARWRKLKEKRLDPKLQISTTSVGS